MKRYEMIKDKKDFTNTIKNGKYYKNNFFVIYIMDKKKITSKFGIAISKKIGTAVQRNKLKRQTRSIIDKNRNLFKNDYDYIIMIRKECKNITFNKMNESFINLLKEI